MNTEEAEEISIGSDSDAEDHQQSFGDYTALEVLAHGNFGEVRKGLYRTGCESGSVEVPAYHPWVFGVQH